MYRESSEKWYDTNWAWWWILLFWPVAVYAFYKRDGGAYKWLIIIGIPALGIIGFVSSTSSPKYYTTLSKQEAGERCFSRYLESDLMSSKADIHFRDKMVLKVGENRYAARIKYTFNGQERYLNCGTYYLNNGEVWLKAYD